MTSSSGQEMWSLWEHDKYEPDLYVRHHKDADGCEHTDSLDHDYLNALEADAQALRTRLEALKGALREITVRGNCGHIGRRSHCIVCIARTALTGNQEEG